MNFPLLRESTDIIAFNYQQRYKLFDATAYIEVAEKSDKETNIY